MYRVFAQLVFFPTFWWNLWMAKVLGKRNWWDEVDPALILGARPNRNDATKLAGLGVTGVVNTCEEYEGPVDRYQDYQIQQLHIPTIDFTHPRIEDVEKAVEFITSHAEKGGRVYVHCKAGRARSATVAICWLMQYRHMSGQQAQERLLRARQHVNRRLLNRPVVIEFQRRRELNEKPSSINHLPRQK
jgi:atypical dual specificity phosphatase